MFHCFFGFFFNIFLPWFWVTKLTLHVAWFLLYPKELGGCTPLGIPNSTHGMKLKPRPGIFWPKMLIDEVITLGMWPTCILQTRKHFCFVISEPLFSNGLSFSQVGEVTERFFWVNFVHKDKWFISFAQVVFQGEMVWVFPSSQPQFIFFIGVQIIKRLKRKHFNITNILLSRTITVHYLHKKKKSTFLQLSKLRQFLDCLYYHWEDFLMQFFL